MNKKILVGLTAAVNRLVQKQVIPAKDAAEILMDFSRSVKGRDVTEADLEDVIMKIYSSDINFDKVGEIEDAENTIRSLLKV